MPNYSVIVTGDPAHITRDSFARSTLMRRRVAQSSSSPITCRECGQRARFVYRWEPDSIRAAAPPWSEPFCGIDCYRSYIS